VPVQIDGFAWYKKYVIVGKPDDDDDAATGATPWMLPR
jgi:hypothetical protein